MPERTRTAWPACRADEVAPGEVKLVTVKNLSIGVFNVHGEYIAILNICPHELAPVCRGYLRGTTLPSPPGEYRWGREGEIIACPWHGWEFDLLTGESLFDPRIKVRRYPTVVEDGIVSILL